MYVYTYIRLATYIYQDMYILLAQIQHQVKCDVDSSIYIRACIYMYILVYYTIPFFSVIVSNVQFSVPCMIQSIESGLVEVKNMPIVYQR